MFVEVNHGPFLLDNNLLLSDISLRDWSQGGAYAHNLLAGQIQRRRELTRNTPYHVAHSTEIKGLANIPSGDNRFFNNLFVGNAKADQHDQAVQKANADMAQGFGLWVYDLCEYPSFYGGNVLLNGACPATSEPASIVKPDFAPGARLMESADGFHLVFARAPEGLAAARCLHVTTATLGKARLPDCPYVNADGSPLAISVDYTGKTRDLENPAPGPFEDLKLGKTDFRVW